MDFSTPQSWNLVHAHGLLAASRGPRFWRWWNKEIWGLCLARLANVPIYVPCLFVRPQNIQQEQSPKTKWTTLGSTSLPAHRQHIVSAADPSGGSEPVPFKRVPPSRHVENLWDNNKLRPSDESSVVCVIIYLPILPATRIKLANDTGRVGRIIIIAEKEGRIRSIKQGRDSCYPMLLIHPRPTVSHQHERFVEEVEVQTMLARCIILDMFAP